MKVLTTVLKKNFVESIMYHIRLRRHYMQAKKDIYIAIKWLLSIEKSKYEQKTQAAYATTTASYYRQLKYKETKITLAQERAKKALEILKNEKI